jgi:hypothetical protein
MRVVISEQILTQTLEDELVVLDIDTGRYFGLQAIGHRVWQLLAELGDTDQVVEALQLEFDADEATLRNDVKELVDSLVEAGLITSIDSPA